MRKTLLIVLAVVLVGAGLVAGVVVLKHKHAAVSESAIPVSGGVQLSATVIKPTGSGLHPLVVMPTAWGSKQTEYLGVGALLARSGFVVVAYTQRGFNASGGQIDFGGPTTVGDVTTVIDWAIKNLSADSSKVGLLGQSYGAGVGLLAAERDPRIKAVVALSTWTTFGGSIVQNGTLASRTLASLIGGGSTPTRHLDPEITTLSQDFGSKPAAAIALINSLSAVRSPVTDIAALNKNKTAVMMANGFQDSLFNPQQLVSFYDELTGPKRLELGTGDHGQAEALGMLSGRAIGPIGDAVLWLQRYVQGVDNGIDHKAPIELEDSATGQEDQLTSWPTTSSTNTVALRSPTGAMNYGTTATKWTSLIAAGHDTGAASPLEDLNLASPYSFATADLSKLDARTALHWDGAVLTSPQKLQGSGTLTVSLTGTASTSSFFAYLYDVKPSGVGTLMSVTPDTVTGLDRTSAKSVSLSLVPIDWTVPAGDHVTLVIDTDDAKWTSQAPAGSTLGISAPSSLTLPTS